MPLVEASVGVALGWAAQRLLDAGATSILKRLKNQAAEAELTEITARAVEAAVKAAPAIREDLRSKTFLLNVIGNVAISRLQDPATDSDPNALAEIYIGRFVAPWARDGDVDGTMERLLQTKKAELLEAMAAFIEAMRAGLFASEHWKDVGRDRTLEELHDGVGFLVAHHKASGLPQEISLDTARADARTGSQDLLEWRRDTAGAKIARPELERLLNRIKTEPRGRTLLVGEAGAGKSALMAELTYALEREGITVYGLKADMIPPEVRSTADLSAHLGLNADLAAGLDVLANAGPLVLVIDQLDAVSDVMDRTSQRMRLLLNLAKRFGSDPEFDRGPPVHVVVSSRPFEAKHDARFHALGAEVMQLALPSPEAVDGLLREVGLDPGATPVGLKETIRRPFALRLYVELVRAGAAIGVVTPSDLLNAWLMSRLIEPSTRAAAIAFLERLADDMTEAESLWMPADVYDQREGSSVATCEAAGLVIRQSERLGFSHQSWLDDFQARTFNSGKAIAEFAWGRQDGLFVRATVLRALERLRRYHPDAYDTALDLFLSDERTRRHLRHLVVDIMSLQPDPRPKEVAWVEAIIRSDPPLARRAVGKLSDHWGAWREGLRRTIPLMMRSEELKWSATLVLRAEASLPEAEALTLIEREWSDPEHDAWVLEVMRRTPLWSPAVKERLVGMAERGFLSASEASFYIDNLVEAGRPGDAVELLRTFLESSPREDRARLNFYKISRLAEIVPTEVARTLTPWFAELVTPPADAYCKRAGYARHDGCDGDHGKLNACPLAKAAKCHPSSRNWGEAKSLRGKGPRAVQSRKVVLPEEPYRSGADSMGGVADNPMTASGQQIDLRGHRMRVLA